MLNNQDMQRFTQQAAILEVHFKPHHPGDYLLKVDTARLAEEHIGNLCGVHVTRIEQASEEDMIFVHCSVK